MDDLIVIIGEGRTQLHARVIFTANGYIVILNNGDDGHIGVTALLEPYTNAKQGISVTESYISAHGHREYELIKAFRKIVKQKNRIVCIIAGVHITEASTEELEAVIANTDKIVSELLIKL